MAAIIGRLQAAMQACQAEQVMVSQENAVAADMGTAAEAEADADLRDDTADEAGMAAGASQIGAATETCLAGMSHVCHLCSPALWQLLGTAKICSHP